VSKDNMDFDKKREKYWNEDYMHYWSNRVSEANQVNSESSTIIKGDANTTTDKTYINAIKFMTFEYVRLFMIKTKLLKWIRMARKKSLI